MTTYEQLEVELQQQQQPELLAGFAAQCMRDREQLVLYSPSGVHSLASFVHHRTTEVDVACKDTSGSGANTCYSGEERARQSVTLKFGDFVDYYSAAHANERHWLADVDDLEFYLCQCPIAVYRPDATCATAALPRIMDDFVVPATLPFRPSALSQVNLWIAVRASRTSLHYDAYANVLVVLYGRKIVTLFAPSESGNVYALPVYSTSANHSNIDVPSPDLTAHPRFAHAVAQQFVVNAGDALVIPEGWWHQVDTDAGTIAINYWCDGLQKQLVSLATATAAYSARVLLHELITRESARYLAAKCSIAAAETPMTVSSRAVIDHVVQQVVAARNQSDRERALFAVAHADDDRVFRDVQQRLATDCAAGWRVLLESASDDFVALLTASWERSDSQQSHQQFVSTLFSGFGDDGEQIRQQLMAKQHAFTQTICANVVRDTFGLSVL